MTDDKRGPQALSVCVAGLRACSGAIRTPEKFAGRVRGVVLEAGTTQPVSDVEVSLIERPAGQIVSSINARNVVQKTTTNFAGAFSFDVDAAGRYVVEIAKEGYNASGPALQTATTVDKDHQEWKLNLSLSRPGELRGRLVDAETKEPMGGVRLLAIGRQYIRGTATINPRRNGGATTDAAGRFVIKALQPGEYFLRALPRIQPAAALAALKSDGLERLVTSDLEDSCKAAAWDYEEGWLPGGIPALGDAIPTLVPSGGVTQAGDLVVRKQPVHCVRVLAPTKACGPGQVVSVDVTGGIMGTTAGEVPCGKDFLLRGYTSGSYRLEMMSWSKGSDILRATVPFTISDKDIEVSAVLARGFDVDGSFVLAEGSAKPEFSSLQPQVRPVGWVLTAGEESHPVDETGVFHVKGAAAREQRVYVYGLMPPWYIREIRYNGSAVPGDVVSISAFAIAHSIQIVIDDKSATLSGTATQGDKPAGRSRILLVKLPVSGAGAWTSIREVAGDGDGRFQFAGIPPGDYRLVAVAEAIQEKANEPGVLDSFLRRGENVTLPPRGYRDVRVRVIETW